jgi:predicted DNA-binding transcriptional regulator AlpA
MSTEKKIISLEELMQLIGLFDWYYMMSDDHSVWSRGEGNKNTIIADIYALSAEDLQKLDEWWNSLDATDPIGARKWVQSAIDEAKRRHGVRI